jgi:quinol monooxygenase YgiN
MHMAIVTTGTTFIARFKLNPARIPDFLRAHQEIQDKSGSFMHAEAHFIFYGWGREENEWVAIECWKREETLNTLRAHPEFVESVKRLLSCCAAPIEITLYVGMNSERAQFDQYPTGVSGFHPKLGDLHVKFV